MEFGYLVITKDEDIEFLEHGRVFYVPDFDSIVVSTTQAEVGDVCTLFLDDMAMADMVCVGDF